MSLLTAMLQCTPYRFCLAALAALSLFAIADEQVFAQSHPVNHSRPAGRATAPRPVTNNSQHLPPASPAQQQPAPIVRSAAPAAQVSVNPHPAPLNGAPPVSQMQSGQLPPGQKAGADLYGHGEHLTAWMSAHNNLTLSQQQEALGHEPGFRDLPAPTQQRIRERLTQLSGMEPDKRAKLLARNEQMERLNPEQRAQVRGAMTELSELPTDQRKSVAQTFRSLRGVPPSQRNDLLNNDPRYRAMNAPQRATLQHLIQVEPILPRDTAPQQPQP